MKKNVILLAGVFAGAFLVGSSLYAWFGGKVVHAVTHEVKKGADTVSKGAQAVGKAVVDTGKAAADATAVAAKVTAGGIVAGAKGIAAAEEAARKATADALEKAAQEAKKQAAVVAQKMKDAVNTVAECGQAAAYGAQFAGTTALQAAADSVGGALDKIFNIKSISIEGNSSKLLGQGALPEVTVTGNLLGKSVSFNVALNIGDSAESVAAIVKQVIKLL